MDVFSPLILLVAPLIMAAYICRLAMLSFKHNSPVIILFHMGLAIATGWAGYRAWIGDPQFGDVAAVIAAGCWIVISYPSWKYGPPSHYETRPTPLAAEEWLNVHGGNQKD